MIKHLYLIILALFTAPMVAAPPVPDFASWNFVLWDYADEVSDVPSAQQHWSSLVAFAQKNQIKRVITIIKDPGKNPFFDANQQSGNQYFIYWAGQLAKTAPNCDLCVFFELSPFTNGGVFSSVPADLPPPFPSLKNTGFGTWQEKLSWVVLISQQLKAQGITSIKEIDFDPECPGNGTVDPMEAKQLLINYLNLCRTQVPDLAKMRLGICVGFDMKQLTFANLSNLPLPGPGPDPSNPSAYDIQSLLPSPNYYYFPTLFAPNNWWGSKSTSPLLDSIYVEAYDHSTPYNFTLENTPSVAAANTLHLFRDEPYMPATGTITILSSSPKTVTGTGTDFINQGVVDGTPVGVLQGSSIAILGRVDGAPSSATSAVFYANSLMPVTNSGYYISESPIKWFYPAIDPSFNPQLLNNICMMFSLEPNPTDAPYQQKYQFFGNWTLDAFLQFVNSFYQLGQTTWPIYSNSSIPNTPNVPLPNNFGIYDFRQIQQNPKYQSLLPAAKTTRKTGR